MPRRAVKPALYALVVALWAIFVLRALSIALTRPHRAPLYHTPTMCSPYAHWCGRFYSQG